MRPTRHLATLRRRRSYLRRRLLLDEPNARQSWDHAELKALTWAIELIKRAAETRRVNTWSEPTWFVVTEPSGVDPIIRRRKAPP